MVLLFDNNTSIASPALAPGQDELVGDTPAELTIGLINNMPDSALKATERQFMRLLSGAARNVRIRFHCFSLPSISRSPAAQSHVAKEYSDIAELDRLNIDGLIVTGAEPIAPALANEPYWRDLAGIIEWAKTKTRSTIWSCLAAHAAVLHLDGIERQRLSAKCSGIYSCAKTQDHWLIRGLRAPLKIPHSRLNELREDELEGRGYQVLTRSQAAGVDIFIKQYQSRFIFFQGHPEYDALSLQREYMRDLARFLAGERDDYPAIPANYFDATTETRLASFERHAKAEREPTLAAELPGLTLRGDIAAGVAASVIFRNWLGFLAKPAE
ncbi:homoserine O-succinyltransferase [Bradyrhizobium sp. ARR65]|uniref:homoserine O-succinyltransferase MetA n=1 Tax=Bradyrhizobium sp. ARR65 TaxID=1040989 RepID=UPI000467BEAD|nr:homoserine O-succinyltransferase [Bradyrhizobium sp. ARR65]